MNFNDAELQRILSAFQCLEGETSLSELDKVIIKNVKTHLKTKKCFYFEDNPHENTIDCRNKDCNSCFYLRNDY